ncbi:MAG: pyridoxal phosphate-dependent aminotransferase [Chitinophagales bacterium]|nr:pyridoxal phosphate-dependent aminotransferase [Bacteroidota bacterium]
MPKISIKGKNMPASPIRKLAPFAEQAKKNGVHIYHLNIGQPDIETPHQFWDAIKKIDRKVLEYSPSDGFEEIRKKYAQFFQKRYGLHNLLPEDVLVTTGGSEALMFTLFSILDRDDEIIIPEPLYANYIGFSKSGSINVRPIPTTFENGFALPSIDEFEHVINPKTKAVLICNPNNPTGYAYSDEELHRLKEIVLKHDLFLISDEVYRDFIYSDNQHYTSIFSFPEIEQQAILVDSLSKRFSACGARIGMVATKNKEVLQTVLKFAQQRLSPPTVEQLGAIAMFDVENDYFTKVNIEYRKRRDVLVEGLNAIDGVKCHTPGGAFYCIVQLPVDDADDFCQWMLSDYSYENATVMMAPASGFYATEGKGKNEVRMAYVLNREDLKKAIKCLEEGLKVYNTKK